MNPIRRDIDTFLENEKALELYSEGLRLLRQSGIIDLMRRIGIPKMMYAENSSSMAHQGAWANGYQSAIENLVYFKEMFTEEAADRISKLGPPDYSGVELALKRGYLNKEDLE